MNESWPCSRLMPLPWPWRSLAAYCWRLGDMRSIAPSRLSPPDSDCGTERNGARTGGRRSAGHAESSGVKRSEPDGVRPAISKAVVGISTKQSGGEMSVSATRLEKPNFTGVLAAFFALVPAYGNHSEIWSHFLFCPKQNKSGQVCENAWQIVANCENHNVM